MRQLIPILQYIVANLDYRVNIKSLLFNSTNGIYTAATCDTFYITKHTTFIHGGVTFRVIDFVFNQSFTFTPVGTGTMPLSTNVITLPLIGFHSGTLADATNERGKATKVGQSVIPFIWNREPMTLNRDRSDDSPNYGTVSLELYMLNNCDRKSWLNNDHHKYSIDPMMNVSDRVMDFIYKNQRYFDEVESENITPMVFLEQAQNERLFEENLSGIRSIFDLTIKDLALIECC
jgi:hypothetical protein